MNRSEGAVAFAVMAGTMFLISVMAPLFAYAFNPSAHDPFLLVAVGIVGLGTAGAMYGVSTILRLMGETRTPGEAPAPAPAAPDPRAELMGSAQSGGKPFASAQELMSSVRTLIELENWKLAHQRAFELVEAYPKSEEAAKVKKNLEYLQKKAAG